MVLANDPKLYDHLFQKQQDLYDFEIEEIVPESDGEMADALAEMRRMGLVD